MHNDIIQVEASCILVRGITAEKNIFKMDAVETDCLQVLYGIIEAIQANEDPGYFQSSCTSLQVLGSSNLSKQSGRTVTCEQPIALVSNNSMSISEEYGWTKSLEQLPGFTHGNSEHKLIKNTVAVQCLIILLQKLSEI